MVRLAWALMVCGSILAGWNLYAYGRGYFSYTEPKTQLDISSYQKVEPSKQVTNSNLYEDIPEIGEQIGDLTIPRLSKSFPIYQGTDEQTLKKGVGHFPKSALPGEKNNSVLSGHRDTVFRGLKDVKINDVVIVTTEAGEFLYKIRKTRIVDADDRTVMTPKPRDILTLTTCYPFYFIGDAPQRYIIVGELISSKITTKDL
jgi:sortase A